MAVDQNTANLVTAIVGAVVSIVTGVLSYLTGRKHGSDAADSRNEKKKGD